MISKWVTRFISGAALLGIALSSVSPAFAEQAPDKSGPGVTRVSIVQGSMVVQRGDSSKQVAAVANAPLLPGDYVSTGSNSRGELQFDGATAVRLGGNVQARITNDDPNNRQMQLADGTIELGLVRNDGTVSVDTPSVTVRAQNAGDYRISIGRDGSSWVTARRGSAEVVTPQRTYTLDTGRTLVARGSASDPSVAFTTEVGYDSFDDFNAKRDQTMVAALNASPNLNPDIAGYDNLGAYGQWQDVAGYGNVWVPQQTSNWSPYADGSWTWEDGYGWTWVASEPWGWAPYHYGRWFYANGYGWAWYPPAYNVTPAWSPALVGFFGFGVNVGGAGWNVSLGFGSPGYGWGYPYIGWYPLAPYAPYYPWYPGWAWTGYGWGWPGWGWGGWGWGGNVVNVTRITNVTNIYRYFPHGGVHGVRVGDFQHGTIHGHTFTVNQHNIGGRVGMIHGAVPVTPTRDNLGFGGHTIHAPVTLSRAFDSGRFAAANRTVAARPSFDEQQRGIARALESGAHNAPVSRANDRSTVNDRGAVNDRGTINDRGAVDANRPASRDETSARQENAPAGSWDRFNQARGTNVRGGDVRGNDLRGNDFRAADVRANDAVRSDGIRNERTASSSWDRFSQQRGSVSAPAYDRAYARGDSYGARDSYGVRDSYSARNSYSARDSYGARNPYATEARGSYPSYSRQSYPSYSRQSYPSYSRQSYPSYSRGSYPSAPAYGRGGYSAPHPSGGGYSAPHPSGGGGGGSHDRGRPPQ